ncbi:MAG: hypothetical protein M0Q95_21540, partial [Porticoccaceae bacterium]|nr:hypothetical protein [Porticoccaceae bacterium]
MPTGRSSPDATSKGEISGKFDSSWAKAGSWGRSRANIPVPTTALMSMNAITHRICVLAKLNGLIILVSLIKFP